MSRTELVKKFDDMIKCEVRDRLKDIEQMVILVLNDLKKLESGPRGHIENRLEYILTLVK